MAICEPARISYQDCSVGHCSNCCLHHGLWLLNHLGLSLWLRLCLCLLHCGLLRLWLTRSLLLLLWPGLLLSPLLLCKRLERKASS